MKIITCDQGAPEWFEARKGIPTASEFATIIAKGKDGGASKTRRDYMLKLAGECLSGDLMESYSNAYMERGKAMEDEARQWYGFVNAIEPEQIGFVTNDDGTVGCSPDSFILGDGMLEIKSAAPHVLLDHMLRNTFPAKHKAQCQGGLWVCERDWIDLLIYWPSMKPFTKRAYRDEKYIAGLAVAVEQFNAELAEILEAYAAYGEPLKGKLETSLLMAG